MAQTVITIEPDTPVVTNCIPFSFGNTNGADGGFTLAWTPFAGWIYQNIPAFELQPGDTLAFDTAESPTMTSGNDTDIQLDIALAATTANGGTQPAGAFTQVVSNTATATNPTGDGVLGNFDLAYTAEQAFSFSGGGLIIRFSNPGGAFASDATCTNPDNRILVAGTSNDTSGNFVSRFVRDQNGVFPWDVEFFASIGAFRVITQGTTPPPSGDIDITDTVLPADDENVPFSATTSGTTSSETVTLTNTGNVDVVPTITEDLAAPFSISNPGSCDSVTLMPTESCNLTVQFSPTSSGMFNDAFTVSFAGSNVIVAVSGTGLPLIGPDLTVQKTADKSSIINDGLDVVEFIVTVDNIGSASADAEVVDPLPSGLIVAPSMLPVPSLGTYDAVAGIWDVGNLDPAQSATLSIFVVAEPTAQGCLVNTATAQLDSMDPGMDIDPSNDSASVILGASECADLEVELIVSDAVFPGDVTVFFEFTVTNNGPQDASNLTIDTSLAFTPPTASFIGLGLRPLPSGVNCNSALDQCTIDTLVPGQSVIIIRTLVFDEEELRAFIELPVDVTASIGGGPDDPDGSNNSLNDTAIVFGTGGSGGSSSGSNCFIATAAYGSYMEPEVMLLRQFRDKHLLSNSFGRVFVEWYYANSPAYANAIAESEFLRSVARAGLAPLVYSVKYPGAAGMLMLLGLGMLLAFGLRSSKP